MSTALEPHRTGTERAAPPAEQAPEPPAQEDLNRGILKTAISPRPAPAMGVGFLAVLFTVPAVQVAAELVRKGGVQALEVFTRFPSREALHGYEKELERRSVARGLVQPYLQLVLSGYQGFGNTEAVLGRGG